MKEDTHCAVHYLKSSNLLLLSGLDEFCADLYEPEGCFRDRRKSRALGKLILTDRDSTSPFTSGRNIDWGNFEVYVKRCLYYWNSWRENSGVEVGGGRVERGGSKCFK